MFTKSQIRKPPDPDNALPFAKLQLNAELFGYL